MKSYYCTLLMIYFSIYVKVIVSNSEENNTPKLDKLFQVTKYWDNNNRSLPCTHIGNKRSILCNKVVEFDREGYENSLKDTRKLILSRLNLENDPNVKISENRLSFLKEIQSEINKDDEINESSAKINIHKRVIENKEFNAMHEALGKNLLK